MLPSDNQTPGFPCPRCQQLIPVTIHQLVGRSRFYCMNCGLELTLDSEQSRSAVEQLSQLANEGKLPPK